MGKKSNGTATELYPTSPHFFRARALGLTSVYLATAQVLHSGGGTTKAVKAQRQFYLSRSRIQFAFKHFRFGSAMAVAAAGDPELAEQTWHWLGRASVHQIAGGSRACEGAAHHGGLFCDDAQPVRNPG